jgi:hypothetical protein
MVRRISRQIRSSSETSLWIQLSNHFLRFSLENIHDVGQLVLLFKLLHVWSEQRKWLDEDASRGTKDRWMITGSDTFRPIIIRSPSNQSEHKWEASWEDHPFLKLHERTFSAIRERTLCSSEYKCYYLSWNAMPKNVSDPC